MNSIRSRRLKVSFIEYLNAIPLGWGFLYGKQRGSFEVLLDIPAECSRHLALCQADVGLIPVVEYHRIAGLRVLPGISIASRQEVRSVLFVSRMPIERVSNVVLDRSSRTSVALLKILLAEVYQNSKVNFSFEKPDLPEMLRRYDAALVIGNPALRDPGRGFFTYDLASEWYKFTGLPFVFAFWGVRPGVDLGDDLETFYASREEGLAELNTISTIYGEKLGLDPAEIRSYLSENLDYSLDEPNLRGLEKFFEFAEKRKILQALRPLEFYRS